MNSAVAPNETGMAAIIGKILQKFKKLLIKTI